MHGSTTHVRGTTADTIENVIDTVRTAVGADDVRLERAGEPTGAATHSTLAVEVDVRGGAVRRLRVSRGTPLSDAEQAVVRRLADLLGIALGAAHDHDLAGRVADLVDRAVLELDAMIGATVEERLVKIGRDLAEVLDVAGWSVRVLVDGAWVLVAHEHRRGRLADPAGAWAPFDPRVLELDEGSVAVRAGEPSSVSGALDHCSLTSLVGAIGYDPDAVSWTLCLVGDATSGDLTPGRTALAGLMPAALGFPLAPRAGGLMRSVG